jgi:hypothetical protein
LANGSKELAYLGSFLTTVANVLWDLLSYGINRGSEPKLGLLSSRKWFCAADLFFSGGLLKIIPGKESFFASNSVTWPRLRGFYPAK